MKRNRNIVTYRTSYLLRGSQFVQPDNRVEACRNPAIRVQVTTTHTRHAETPKGERYTIRQVATASNPELLRRFAEELPFPAEFSADGLTFVRTTEI